MSCANFQSGIESIFQIKIKQDNICRVFDSINSKIISLQNQIKSLKIENRKQSGQMHDPEAIKKFIKQQISYSTFSFNQKYDTMNKTLNNIKYNHQNLCSNMGDQFKILETRLYQFQHQNRIRTTEQFIKINEEIGKNKQNISKIDEIFSRFIQQTRIKGEQYDKQVDKIWQIIRNIKEKPIKFQPMKRTEPRCSIFGRNDSIKQLSQQQQSNISKKVRIYPRKTNQSRKQSDQDNIIDKQYRNVENGCLLLRIESLQKRIQQINNSKGATNMISSKRKLQQSNNFNQSLRQNNEISSTIVIQKKKWKSPNQVHRLNRNSIRTEHTQHQLSSFKDEAATSAQIKKINQKIGDLKFKYTFLQENYEIILNKITRINHIQSSIQSKMDQVQKLRVDLATINQINMRFRKIQSSYQQQQSKYVFKDIYSKDIVLIKQSIKQIHQNVIKKSNKEEVKEAFTFVQTKIKELAIILTDKFQVQKEGAINKIKQIRCLTCDKEVEDNSSGLQTSLHTAQGFRTVKIRDQYSKSKKKSRVTYQCTKTQQAEPL